MNFCPALVFGLVTQPKYKCPEDHKQDSQSFVIPTVPPRLAKNSIYYRTVSYKVSGILICPMTQIDRGPNV